MTNVVLKGIFDLLSWVTSSKVEPEVSATYNPKLAKTIEKHHSFMDEHPEAHTLLDLANALRKEYPDIEDLDTIQNAYNIIETIQPPGYMNTVKEYSTELSDVSVKARTALEAEHGILSNLSMQRAQHLIREEEDTPNKLYALIEEIVKNPDAVDAIKEGTKDKIFRAMEAIEDISIGIIPSQDNIEAFKYLTGRINSIVSQRYHKTPDTKDLIEAAYDIYTDRDLVIELHTLHANTARNLSSFFDKSENTPRANNKLYLAAIPE